jgi:hypothetical protein
MSTRPVYGDVLPLHHRIDTAAATVRLHEVLWNMRRTHRVVVFSLALGVAAMFIAIYAAFIKTSFDTLQVRHLRVLPTASHSSGIHIELDGSQNVYSNDMQGITINMPNNVMVEQTAQVGVVVVGGAAAVASEGSNRAGFLVRGGNGAGLAVEDVAASEVVTFNGANALASPA